MSSLPIVWVCYLSLVVLTFDRSLELSFSLVMTPAANSSMNTSHVELMKEREELRPVLLGDGQFASGTSHLGPRSPPEGV